MSILVADPIVVAWIRALIDTASLEDAVPLPATGR